MEIRDTIEYLNKMNHLPFHVEHWELLNGGTSSKVWKLTSGKGEFYVLKYNEEEVIKEEVLFLKNYHNLNLLPNVMYIGKDYKYYVYPFVSGDIQRTLKNKKEMLITLVHELVKNYDPFPDSQWGWISEPSDDWNQFLLREILEAREIVHTVLTIEDFELVRNLSEKRERCNQPYLLHGDCGLHNFLHLNDKLVGVIDPIPLAGPRLYELVYAFCSSPEQLTLEVITDTVRILDNEHYSQKQIVEEVIIGLYIRLERCLYHHREDLNDYLKAWSYWKSLS